MKKQKTDNENPQYDSSSYLIKRIFKEHIMDYKFYLTIAILAMVINGFIIALNAYMIQPIVDNLFIKKDFSFLILISCAVLAVSVLNAGFYFIEKYYMEYIVQNITVNMQLKLYKHLLYFDLKSLSEESSGKIISKLSSDIQILKDSIMIIISGIAKDFITLLFLIGLMFYQSVELSLIIVCLFPFSVYPLIKIAKKMRSISKGIQEKMEDFISHLDETFKNIRIVKSYNGEQLELEQNSNIMSNFLKLNLKAVKSYSLISPMIEVIAGISIALITLYGGYKVINGEATSGEFISFITAMLIIYKPIKKLSKVNASLQSGMASASRIFKLLDKKPLYQGGTEILKIDNKANISFKKVNFVYDKDRVIENLNLEIKAGTTIALIGPSGAGKTTIVNMLPRLYDIHSGSIEINGQNIKNFTLESLREKISLISQEITIFNTSVENNITYPHKGKIPEEEIHKAAEMAYAKEFIEKLPNGYKTKLGQNGMKLSRGQRQRISIARAIMKNAPILIMDEATSALDNISEKKIQLSLENLMKSKTSVIIAHRLSTVINADLIYIIEDGKISEYGNHKELIKNSDKYRKLHLLLKNDQN